MRKDRHKRLLLTAVLVAAGWHMGTLAVAADQAATQDQTTVTEKTDYPDAVRQSPTADIGDDADINTINEGLRALSAGDMSKARDVLSPLASGDATESGYIRARALQGLAVAAMRDKDYAQAVDDLEQALTLADVIPNKPYFDIQWALIRAHMANKDWQQAQDVLNNWIEASREKNDDYYGVEGELAYRRGKYEDATAAFSKIDNDALWKKHPSWSQMLARSYIQQEAYSDAIQWLQRIQKKDADADWVQSYLLDAYLRSKQYQDAFELLHARYENDALTQSSGYENLAKLYLMPDVAGNDDEKNAQEALNVLQHGLDTETVEASAAYYELMATAAQKAGDTDKAVEAYRAADELSDDGEAALQAGRLLGKQGEHADARKMAQRAISKGTKYQGRAWLLIANAAINDSNRKEATTAMENAAKDPETEATAKQWLEQQQKAQQYTW